MIDTIMSNPGEIELVTLGPLTNLALALRIEPRIVDAVKRVVTMGGTAVLPGNITPLAEFNFWADPEAAFIVANSGLNFEMAGWDISTAHAVIHDDLAAELRSLGTLGAFAVDIQGVLREFCRNETLLDGFDLPDPLAMAIAIDPSIVLREARHVVDVIPGDGPARGQTIVDERNPSGREPNCRVIYEVDRDRFLQLLHGALRGGTTA
jgi:purine nucleosidase